MARAIWSGSVSFGLVNVPVKVYSAVKEKDVHFHQLEEGTGSRVRMKRVSEETGEEVPYDHIVKGYEIAKGTYVPIEPEELESVEPESTHTIDIEDFVALADIDPVHFDDAYYLVPDGSGAGRAYALLTKAMEQSGRVAIGRFVLRTKQHLVALRPLDDVLTLHTLFYADEVVDRATLDGVPAGEKVGKKELAAADRLIDSLTTDWDPERYHDTYREAVLEMVERKAEGEDVVQEAPKEHKAEVLDLMAALEASLARGGGKGGGRSAGTSRTGAADESGRAAKASASKEGSSKSSSSKTSKSKSSPSKSSPSKTSPSKTTSSKTTPSKTSSSKTSPSKTSSSKSSSSKSSSRSSSKSSSRSSSKAPARKSAAAKGRTRKSA